MKRKVSVSLMVVLAMLVILSVTAVASQATAYRVGALDLTLDIPNGHVVFTRETTGADSYLGVYGLTEEGMRTFMEENNCYLNAWDYDATYEIVITMTDALFDDYDQHSDTSTLMMASVLTNAYESLGIDCAEPVIYRHRQAKFIKIPFSRKADAQVVYSLQYTTTYGGKMINITLHSSNCALNSHHEQVLSYVVDSVEFGKDPKLKAKPAQTDAFVYLDKATGTSFTVPANWTETPMSKKRKYIDAKFVSNVEDGLCIVFTSEDIFSLEEFAEAMETISSVERKLVSRKMLNQSLFNSFSEAELYALIGEMTGGKVHSIERCTYGAAEYLLVDATTSSEIYGMSVSIRNTWLLHIENGYMYMFHFGWSKDSPFFDDFEALVASVEYPSVPSRKAADNGWIIVLLVVIVALVLAMLLRKKRRRTASTQWEYCSYCGRVISGNDAICQHCGKPVTKQEE